MNSHRSDVIFAGSHEHAVLERVIAAGEADQLHHSALHPMHRAHRQVQVLVLFKETPYSLPTGSVQVSNDQFHHCGVADHSRYHTIY